MTDDSGSALGQTTPEMREDLGTAIEVLRHNVDPANRDSQLALTLAEAQALLEVVDAAWAYVATADAPVPMFAWSHSIPGVNEAAARSQAAAASYARLAEALTK
jgi:hypothetical protein